MNQKRLDKRRPKLTATFCFACGKDHAAETKLESSRRRRVRSIQRRQRRRMLRQSSFARWLYSEMEKAYHEEMSYHAVSFISNGLSPFGIDFKDIERITDELQKN